MPAPRDPRTPGGPAASLRVVASFPDADALAAFVERNVERGGIFLDHAPGMPELELMSEIDFVVELPAADSMRFRGRVVHALPPSATGSSERRAGYGLQLLGVSRTDRERLQASLMMMRLNVVAMGVQTTVAAPARDNGRHLALGGTNGAAAAAAASPSPATTAPAAARAASAPPAPPPPPPAPQRAPEWPSPPPADAAAAPAPIPAALARDLQPEPEASGPLPQPGAEPDRRRPDSGRYRIDVATIHRARTAAALPEEPTAPHAVPREPTGSHLAAGATSASPAPARPDLRPPSGPRPVPTAGAPTTTAERPVAPPSEPPEADPGETPDMTVAGATSVLGTGDITEQVRRFLDTTNPNNPFGVFGIGKDATERDVQSAYATLMKRLHPDGHRAAGLPPRVVEDLQLATKRLVAARRTLLNPEERREAEKRLGLRQETLVESRRRLKDTLRQQYAVKFRSRVNTAEDLLKEARDLEASGDLAEALDKLRLALTFDPLNEEYRRAVRVMEEKVKAAGKDRSKPRQGPR